MSRVEFDGLFNLNFVLFYLILMRQHPVNSITFEIDSLLVKCCPLFVLIINSIHGKLQHIALQIIIYDINLFIQFYFLREINAPKLFYILTT